jgi:hypothetical protein
MHRRARALSAVLDANSDLDLNNADLSGAAASVRWPDDGAEREPVLELLRAYQRLLRFVPRGDRRVLLSLLERGLHAAIHVAAIPRARFIAELASSFGGDREWAAETHAAALARRSELALRYVKARQSLELPVRPLSARGAKG